MNVSEREPASLQVALVRIGQGPGSPLSILSTIKAPVKHVYSSSTLALAVLMEEPVLQRPAPDAMVGDEGIVDDEPLSESLVDKIHFGRAQILGMPKVSELMKKEREGPWEACLVSTTPQ